MAAKAAVGSGSGNADEIAKLEHEAKVAEKRWVCDMEERMLQKLVLRFWRQGWQARVGRGGAKWRTAKTNNERGVGRTGGEAGEDWAGEAFAPRGPSCGAILWPLKKKLNFGASCPAVGRR